MPRAPVARKPAPKRTRKARPAEVEVVGPLVLLADCEVEYDGRGRSTLKRGHYLLILKGDGTFLVHGARRTTPLNYQPARSRLYRTAEGYFCRGKDESIRVVVHREIARLAADPWDHNDLEIARTERELRDRLARRIGRYIPGVVAVHREFPTEHGAVDLVAVDDRGTYHVVEVKRKRATVHAGVQLRKYVEALAERGHRVAGYVAAPSIAANALAYCQKRGFAFLDVQHARRRPTAVPTTTPRSARRAPRPAATGRGVRS